MALSVKDAERAIMAAGTLLGISGLGGIIYLPILLKSLNGMRRLYIVLQQICIIGFLMTQLLTHVLMQEPEYIYNMETVGFDTGRNADISLLGVLTRKKVSSLFLSFFHYGQYALSLLQSVDIYQMIHDPIKYADFCSKCNVLKLLLIGLCGCFLMVLEDVIVIIVGHMMITDPKEFVFDGPQMAQFHSFTEVLKICSLVKFTLIKFIYSVVIIIIATRTKKALNESARLIANNNKSSLYQGLFVFTLVPLGLNFWYSFSECLDEILPLSDLVQTRKLHSYTVSVTLLRKDVRMYISACTATVGSFAYFIAFPILFPKVRESILCGKNPQ